MESPGKSNFSIDWFSVVKESIDYDFNWKMKNMYLIGTNLKHVY